MKTDCDVCIIGSGAGAGPVAVTLSEAGKNVVVLEKGPWLKEKDFVKDEIAFCQRSVITPDLRDEQHVIEQQDDDGKWESQPTSESGWDFWNGNVVGGSSNFMSGFFHRLKPDDFHLLSKFGSMGGTNVADWPISYNDLEPYYAKVEHEVGVSGRVVKHPFSEPRSTPDFPYPPTAEVPFAKWIDEACSSLGLHPLPVPRAILPYAALRRGGCSYSGYCGSYGCATGAKGSSRAALLNRAVSIGNCDIRAHAMVYLLESDTKGRVVSAHYFDIDNKKQKVTAKLFVVACQAVETSRLLLISKGPKFPNGLANSNGQVGKNLLFSSGGTVTGDLSYADLPRTKVDELKVFGPFVNRALQDWYYIDDPTLGGSAKGGLVEFMFQHPNLLSRANRLKWDGDTLLWGEPLKKKLKSYFTGGAHIRAEIFCDWNPIDDCFVSLDRRIKDRFGLPVARIRIGSHPHDLKVGKFIAEKTEAVFKRLGAKDISTSITPEPPSNLMAGGCRFGSDPKTSVLNSDCRAHQVENLYITDGSFMPTGGSVPYTFTIYANSFRVADKLAKIV